MNIRGYANFLVSLILFWYHEGGGQACKSGGRDQPRIVAEHKPVPRLLLRPWKNLTMGICIEYMTTEAVASEVREAIRADLAHSQSDHSWILCEPPHLYSTESSGKLRGGSMLILDP